MSNKTTTAKTAALRLTAKQDGVIPVSMPAFVKTPNVLTLRGALTGSPYLYNGSAP
jgi:hypothetical protein